VSPSLDVECFAHIFQSCAGFLMTGLTAAAVAAAANDDDDSSDSDEN